MIRKLIHSTTIEGLESLIDGQEIEVRPKLSCSSLGKRNLPREIILLVEVDENDIIAEYNGDAATDENGVSLRVKNYGWDEILVRGGAYKVIGFYADENSEIDEDAYLLIFASYFYNDENPEVEGKIAEELYDKAYDMYINDDPYLEEIAERYDTTLDDFIKWMREKIIPKINN